MYPYKNLQLVVYTLFKSQELFKLQVIYEARVNGSEDFSEPLNIVFDQYSSSVVARLPAFFGGGVRTMMVEREL